MVLAAGAKDRAWALATGLQTGNVALARAALESGPVLESQAPRLREQFGQVEGELAEILAAVKTRPVWCISGAAAATIPARSGSQMTTLTPACSSR